MKSANYFAKGVENNLELSLSREQIFVSKIRELVLTVLMVIFIENLLCQKVSGVITTITRDGCDVILSWQSQSNQVFIVQYRESLNPDSDWVTLTNGLPAGPGNITTFRHSNVLPNNYQQLNILNVNSLKITNISPEERAKRLAAQREEADKMVKLLEKQLEEAVKKADNQKKTRYSSGFLKSSTEYQTQSQDASTEGFTSWCGFYRVFIPEPVAKIDIFEITQNSVSNQLDILANDDDPEGYGFTISELTPAGYGEIFYTINGSIFQYTPVAGFKGLDSFTYTITNEVGGSSTAMVWVFVNEIGNTPPAASPLYFTLETNQVQVTFDALTNAVDSDGDNLSIAFIIPPTRGVVRTNDEGLIIYERNSDYPLREEFFAVITDGRGGFVKRAIVVLLKDSDNDGMPDEWEIRNGLNPSVDDGYSDPDGDGLPNLAEYKLMTNPNRQDNPLNLSKINPNTSFSGYAKIPLGINPKIDPQPITLLLNGLPSYSFLDKRADGSWYFYLDTGYMTNGIYLASLKYIFKPDAQPPQLSTIISPSIPIIITNEVIFDQINSGFSDFWTMHLTFSYTPVEWRIELYDEYDNYLAYDFGTETNRDLYRWWDLTDGNGKQIAYGNIIAFVYTAPAGQELPPEGSKSLATAYRWFFKEGDEDIGDTFVVAWGWDTYNSGFIENREQLMLYGVINILGDPTVNDTYQLRPGANQPFSSTFRFDDQIDKDVLLKALAAKDSGNFYWFGHGDGISISGNPKKSMITTGDIEGILKNKKHRSKPPKQIFRNEHPYRLVILDGCNTYSKDWCDAFGIDFTPDGSQHTVREYQFFGRKPRAFLGWTDITLSPTDFGWDIFDQHLHYTEALQWLFGLWMYAMYPLEDCLYAFSSIAVSYGFNGMDKYKISGCKDLMRYDP